MSESADQPIIDQATLVNSEESMSAVTGALRPTVHRLLDAGYTITTVEPVTDDLSRRVCVHTAPVSSRTDRSHLLCHVVHRATEGVFITTPSGHLIAAPGDLGDRDDLVVARVDSYRTRHTGITTVRAAMGGH